MRASVMKIHTDQRGTTLISVVVAIAILTVALSMAVSTFYSASRLTRRSMEFTAASNYAEGVLEKTELMPYSQLHTMEITGSLPKLKGAQCMQQVTETNDGLKQVTVTCSWLSGSQKRSVRLSTLAARGSIR